MNRSRIPSPARSHGAPITPRRSKPRGSRSIGSPARSNASGRLTSVIEQFKENNRESFVLSPLNKTVLTDNTDIEQPRRKSWYKKVDTSRDVIEILETENVVGVNNVIEEFDIEILSQEKKNYTLDMPESSGSESICSIVVPQRKLFTQKDNLPPPKFDKVIGNRDSLPKQNKTNLHDKTANIGRKNLFNQASRRSKPVFPAALLNMSPDKTVSNKTKEIVTEVKGQPRNLFGNRPGTKRKNIFADFIASESEDEISDIQPKLFAFQKNMDPVRHSPRRTRNSSPASSITADIEMDDWKFLPSSTMVDHQLEAIVVGTTPGKKIQLSKLSEGKESEPGTSISATSVNKTKVRSIMQNTKDKHTSDKQKENNEKDDRKDGKEISDRNQESDNDKMELIEENDKQNKLSDQQEKLDEQKDEHTALAGQDEEVDGQLPADKSDKMDVNEADKQCDEDESNQLEEIVINKADQPKKLEERKNDELEKQSGNEDDELYIQQINKQDKFGENQSTQEQSVNKTNRQEKLDRFWTDKLEEQGVNEVNEPVLDENETNEQDKSVINEVAENEEIYGHNDVLAEQDMKETAEQKLDENEIDEQENINEADVQNNQKEALKCGHNEEEGIEIEEAVQTDEEQEEEDESVDHSDDQHEDNDNEDELEQENENVEDDIGDDNDDQHVDSGNEEELEQESENIEDNEDQHDDNENGEVLEQESENVDDDDDDQYETNEHEQLEQNSESDEDNDDQHDNENEVEIVTHKEIQNQSQEIENESDNQEANSEDSLVLHLDEGEDTDEEMQNESEDAIQNSEEVEHAESENEEQEDAEEIAEEMEHIPEPSETETNSPNMTHDTTGKYRKKDKSIEAILHNVTNQNDSFTAKGRNTSVRKTIVQKNFSIRPSLIPPRDSVGFSDGTRNSSAEGSGWDSHRTTRKTLRQTFGRDFTPRKSLRTLVMEKAAKRRTEINEANANLKAPQANSTELPEDDHLHNDHDDPHDDPRDEPHDYPQDEPHDDSHDEDMGSEEYIKTVEQSDHEISKRTRQTTLEMYLQKIKKENMERKQKIEAQVRDSLKLNAFRIDVLNRTYKPTVRRPAPKSLQNAPKRKRIKSSVIPLEDLPSELVEDMKYKPPKRYRPSNASWITKRLYNFLESKLEPKYDYKARVRAERLVEKVYEFAHEARRLRVATPHAINELKYEMARLDIVQTHFDFYTFFHDFMPVEVKVKVVPDIVNKLPLPRNGVFSNILNES